MHTLFYTRHCPYCSNTPILSNGSLRIPLKRDDVLQVPVRCDNCGWYGTELWNCHMSHYTDLHNPPKSLIEPTVPMYNVMSSVIKSIGYDRETATLYMQFHSSNKVYGYTAIDASIFIDFLNADHLRHYQYYLKHIKGQYTRL